MSGTRSLRYHHALWAFLFLLVLFLLPATILAGLPFRIDNPNALHAAFHATSELDEIDTVSAIPLKALGYHFTMNLAEMTDTWYTASTEVELRNDGSFALSTIELNAAVGLVDVQLVRVLPDNETVPFSQIGNLLTIEQELASAATILLEIDYRLTPGTITGPFGAMGLWWNGTRGYTFSFPDGAQAWAPVVDDPGSKATVTWTIGTIPSLTAVANGSLISDETIEGIRWQQWSEPNPVCTSEMGLAVADYAIIVAQTEPFPIRYYVYRADSSDAAFDFGRVPEAMALFEEAFGHDYPFAELKIVECGVFNGNGGQEHQTMISLGHNMITGNRDYESIVMHEIAHQWFADFLTPVDWTHFWLNEGFATYSEALWAEHLNGWSAYRAVISQQRNSFLSWESTHSDALVNSNYNVTMNSPLPYERGGLALHQLRMRYGMEVFTSAVSDYLTQNAYGHVSSETLEQHFHAETGDDALAEWFQQWIWRGEVPHFRYAITPDGSTAHIRQSRTGSSAPDHGGLYDRFRVYYGTSASPDNDGSDWPVGAGTMTLEGLPQGGTLFPNFEIPCRFERLNDIHSAVLLAKVHITSETVFPDRVLQPDETVSFSVSFANDGLPLTNVTWEIETISGGMIWSVTSGTLTEIEFLQPFTPMLTVEATGAGSELPGFGEYRISITGDNYTASFPFIIALGTAEVLIISDGVAGAADSLAPALEAAGIVHGYADLPIPDLPEDMFGARVVMVEADGRYAEHLFTPGDEVLRTWFTEGRGSGSVTGIYMDQIYSGADPSWLGGMAGEWGSPINHSVFLGIENDPITDGRAAISLQPAGTTVCYPCCDTPLIMMTSDQQYVVGARLDQGWRIVNFGLSLSHLSNQSNVPMRRNELVQRVANWCLYRTTDLSDDMAGSLPTEFVMSSYPNPFNTSLRLEFAIPHSGHLRVEVFNLLGQRVAVLNDEAVKSGRIPLIWMATDQASGAYFVRSQLDEMSVSSRVLLVR